MCVVCGDFQNCADSVSFPTHVGSYPKVSSDQITLACVYSVCIFMYCSYIHVFMLMCLIACAQLPSFTQPVVSCLVPHTTHLGKGLEITLSNKVLN